MVCDVKISGSPTASLKRKFPLASEFITDDEGRVSKVILDVNTFQRLVEEYEDDALWRAMKKVRREIPLSKDDALKAIESD